MTRRADCLLKPKRDDLGPSITAFLQEHPGLQGGYYYITTPIQLYLHSGVLKDITLELNPDTPHCWDIHGDSWDAENTIFQTKLRHVKIVYANGQTEIVNP
jgi:hypothetical protein